VDDQGQRTLDEVRADIDAVDAELVSALARRTALTQEVGRIKGGDNRPFFTPERERQIFEKLAHMDSGALKKSHLVAIFREIISAGRAAEKVLTIAFWGPVGTYSHQAAVETFGRSVDLLPVDSIRDVFLAVDHGQADYGLAPIENSTAGVIPETLDMFPSTNVKICAETFINVHHHLGSRAKSLAEVTRVYAGPQPAAQCRHWLREHLPQAEVVDMAPTARAAEKALSDPSAAAIANRLCLETYDLDVLAEHIEDQTNNRTRFVVLGHNTPAPSGSDKTTLMFNLRNRPGELYAVLGSFNKHGVNLLMIESRPAQRAAFEYIFYVDCGGHHTEPHVASALAEIREEAMETVVLGSYPSYDPSLRDL